MCLHKLVIISPLVFLLVVLHCVELLCFLFCCFYFVLFCFLTYLRLVIASDGQEALEMLEDKTKAFPDLILLDNLMPRLDGKSTCIKIREVCKFHPNY